MVERLLSEGRNVSSIAAATKVQGRALPDVFVDGELAEIKTSTKGNARAFGLRVAAVPLEQHASRIFVNAVGSRIRRVDLETTLREIVDGGYAAYIRVIGADYDTEFGRW